MASVRRDKLVIVAVISCLLPTIFALTPVQNREILKVSSTFGSSSLFKSILLQVTDEKLTDLKTQHELMSAHFQPVLDSVAGASTPTLALAKLYAAIRVSPLKNMIRDEQIILDTVKYFLAGAEADPSISEQITRVWVQKLREEIEYALRKCEYSFLYGELLSEWLGIENNGTMPRTNPTATAAEVTKEKALSDLQARMFSPPATPINKTRFLARLREEIFNVSGNVEHQKLLDSIKEEIRGTLDLNRVQITTTELRACIEGLRSEEYVAEEKKTALHQLVENSEVLEEVASLLTNKIRQLHLWEPGTDVKLVLTRGLAGQWRGDIEEDVITMLFMRYIGVSWGVRFKNAFLRLYDGVWKKAGANSDENIAHTHPTSINAFRNTNFRRGLLSELPDSMHAQKAKNPDEYVQLDSGQIKLQADNFVHFAAEAVHDSLARQALPACPTCGYYPHHHGGFSERVGIRPTLQNPQIDLRQQFIHILSTEIKLSHTIRPEFPFIVVQSSYKQFAASLRHEPLLAILEFFDVPPVWLEFFSKFLRMPLEGKERLRGIPDSHVLGSFFGEVALFVLDFHMNRVTGLQLHRVQDQFWILSSDRHRVAAAWTIVEDFGSALGLQVDLKKSGSISTYAKGQNVTAAPTTLPKGFVRWAYLQLTPNGRFTIDPTGLEKFTGEMGALLEKSSCTLEYINVYNKYMEFFVRNFGRNAYVFGDQHVGQITDALSAIHKVLFPAAGGNVVQALKAKFGGNLTRTDVVDVWMYWPLERGGLGLLNPFLEILALHATYEEAAAKQATVEEFEFEPLLLQDRNNYDAHRKQIEERNRKRAEGVGWGVAPGYELHTEIIPTYEAWSAGRESEAGFEHWYRRYVKLLERPSGLQPSVITAGGPAAVAYWDNMGRGQEGDSIHLQWIYSYYEPQLLKHFGTVEFINTKLLPMSMISNIRKSKVKH